MRRFFFLSLASSAFLATILSGVPVQARGGGGHGGGGHGGGGHMGGGGGFRGGGGGGGFRGGGGGGYRGGGGGGYRAPSRSFSAPRMAAPRSFAAPRNYSSASRNFGGPRTMSGARGPTASRPGIGSMPSRAGMGARAPIANNVGGRSAIGNSRSFGNTRAFGVNRGPGNTAFGGGNRVNNINVNRSSVLNNRTNLNVNRVNNVVGTGGNRGFGYSSGYGRGYGGYHRSYGGYGNGNRGYGGYGNGNRGYGGYGYGNRGYGGYGGLGYGGYGYGGYGLGSFGLGYLLGSSLGGFGYGGYGGYGGLGYGGYGGGYGGYGGGYGGYGGGYGGYGYGGPSNWLYGGSLYGYGYSPYSNPYYDSGVSYASPAVGGVVHDYSQPINMVSAPPAESVADDAATLFNSGRSSFKAGDFAQALQQADAALVKNPNDASLHEFRALCFFALGRYDDAATALYAVLSVGPGWDWPTLIDLYPNVNVYTSQLRALEEFVRTHPDSAPSRFVQAYHYATEGHFNEAANALKQVVALKPADTLSAKLLEQIQAAQRKPGDTQTEATPPVPEPVAVNTAVPEGATIAGTWNTEPNADTKVSLAIQAGGAFHWQVTQKGQTQDFSGTSNFGGGILTLVPDKTPPIVGRVSWTDPTHMTFRVVGDSPTASGLSFVKSANP